MTPQPVDLPLLLRAADRCMALARELDGVDASVSRASGHAAMRWSGDGADAFGEVARGQRATATAARDLVARLGALSRDFAHELADEQERARRAAGTTVSAAAEARMVVLRNRFGQQLSQLDGDLNALLLNGPVALLPRNIPAHRIPPRPPVGPVIGPLRGSGPRCRTGPVAPIPADGPVRWGPPWRQL